MGVLVGEATGDHVALIECLDCGEQFETDETMFNDCPECGRVNIDILDTEPGAPWREQ